MKLLQEIEKWAKRCKEEKIAIAIFCDGSWRQLGGPHHLYDLSDEMNQSKVEMAETIRLLKRKLEKTTKEKG